MSEDLVRSILDAYRKLEQLGVTELRTTRLPLGYNLQLLSAGSDVRISVGAKEYGDFRPAGQIGQDGLFMLRDTPVTQEHLGSLLEHIHGPLITHADTQTTPAAGMVTIRV